MKNNGEKAMTTVDPKVLRRPAMKIFLQTGFLFNSLSYAINAPGPLYSFFVSFCLIDKDISSSWITLSISAYTFFFGDFNPIIPAKTPKIPNAPIAQYEYLHPIYLIINTVIEDNAIPTILAEDRMEFAVVLFSGGKCSAKSLKVKGVTAALNACDTTFRIMNRAKESTSP